MNEIKGKTILCRMLQELLPMIQQVYEEREGEINALVYIGKWWALLRVELKFCLWWRALSEHV